MHVDSEGLDAGVLGQHRQDEAQPIAVDAIGDPHRRRTLRTSAQAMDLEMNKTRNTIRLPATFRHFNT